MALKGFPPIEFRQIVPCFIRDRQQSGLIPQRPSSGHLSRPDPGPATGQNHSSGLLGREAIPLFQHGAQTVAPVSSWRRNSSTRLLVTWERYLAVERMSLIGRI